jgi:hypothetical protein
MDVNVYEELKVFINQLLTNKTFAQQYAEDPHGKLAEQGITDGDLSQVDMYQLISECAAEQDLPYSTQQAMQTYSGGGPAPSHYPMSPPPPGAHQSAQEVVQHLNYVTYATYEGDEHITQQLINQENYDYSTNIDNSVDVDVDGDFHGDIETTNVNATGDGAVAAGRDVENAATGEGSQIIDGDNYGQANTGDGAVQAGGDIDAPVNTGINTGIIADGDANNNVVGDHNQTANVEGSADNSVLNFGDGDVTNFGDAQFNNTAVSVGGGDANNVSDNTLYEGAAAAAGGDATGEYENEYHHEETYVDADHSNVGTEQGHGDLDQHAEVTEEEAEEEPANL